MLSYENNLFSYFVFSYFPVYGYNNKSNRYISRGKSVLLKNMLWDVMDKDYCGILVLDPHDEYYGRNELGLKDHPSNNLNYYTSNNPPPGCKSLKINIKIIKFGQLLNKSNLISEYC